MPVLVCLPVSFLFYFFFFNDTATTEIYTLSLHDALPILTDRRLAGLAVLQPFLPVPDPRRGVLEQAILDRKSTRLNSSHPSISYAVFCLKKKKNHSADSTPCNVLVFGRLV